MIVTALGLIKCQDAEVRNQHVKCKIKWENFAADTESAFVTD